jgi:carboxyl-terminal processing protease
VYGHLRVYTEVLGHIKGEYVEEPDMKSVTLGAIDGLLESVDPFASYLTADQYRECQKSAASSKAGVGLILAKRFGYVAVVDAIPDSPADKDKISSGDLLETINGVATRDMPLAYAEELLRGAPGSTVEVSVLRLRNPEPQKLTLTRAVVPLPAITAKLLPDGVGYVHVTSVAGDRIEKVKQEISRLKSQGAKYVVLDLRHCSTGEQANGIALANLFLDKGEIASLRGQNQPNKEFDAQPNDDIWSGPVVVITDRATAGGAEITAAALLGDKRAQVVGERSYGDASVRQTIEMEDHAAIILSVAKYYSPDGKAIQDSGVTPTVQTPEGDNGPETDEDGNPLPQTAPKSTEDSLLREAIDLVTGKSTVAQLTAAHEDTTPAVGSAPAPILPKGPK